MINRVYQSITKTISISHPLVITVPLGYAYEIIGINGYCATAEALEVIIGSKKMAFLPCSPAVNSVCSPSYAGYQYSDFYNQLKEKFPVVPRLVVGEGETMYINPAAGTTSVVDVFYIEHQGNDIPKNTQSGGSESPDRLYVVEGRQSILCPKGTTAVYSVNTTVMPAGFVNFPFSGTVLPGYVYSMLGIVAKLTDNGGGDISCVGMRLWKMNEAVLSPNEQFVGLDRFPVMTAGGHNILQKLEQMISFKENEQASVDVELVNSDPSNDSTAVIDIGFIMLITKGGGV